MLLLLHSVLQQASRMLSNRTFYNKYFVLNLQQQNAELPHILQQVFSCAQSSAAEC